MNLLRLFGWKVEITVPDYPKCIICVAPHTSNLDFIIGKLAYWGVGRRAGFLMKSTWFFFPLGILLRAMGGIPVKRGKGGGNLTEQIVDLYRRSTRLTLAITPEGTRSLTRQWRTGFWHIARQAEIPIVLATIDFRTKTASARDVITNTTTLEADMSRIKEFYRGATGRHPEKFTVD